MSDHDEDEIDRLFNGDPDIEPSLDDPTDEMTIREWACITLKVPMSGCPELDEIIKEARRLDG